MDVDRKRAEWPHWPDRANGPTRRECLERRLFSDSEREAALEQTHAAIAKLELAAAAKAAQVERLEHTVARSDGNNGRPVPATYLVFVRTPDGYGLRDADGDVPAPGAVVSVDGAERVVAKVGPSPLPGDPRRCAYLED